MSRRHFVLAACFVLSGISGLVAEVAWSRMLALSFGSTGAAVATIVAIYMAGLGLGGLVLGRVGDRVARPARFYAQLEFAIAALLLLSPFLANGVMAVFVPLQGWLAPGPAATIAIKALLAALVLGIPTFLMGGTLPVLTRALMGGNADSSKNLGLLYGANTLGAVVGVSLAGFWLIERYGLSGSLALAAGLSVLAAILVLVYTRGEPASGPDPSHPRPGMRELLRGSAMMGAARLAFLAGFGALVAEIAMVRALTLLIGSSTWSFTVVLVVFLLGIGLGSLLHTRRGDSGDPARRLAFAQLLSAVGLLAFLLGIERLDRIFILVQQNPLLGASGGVLIKALIVIAALLPATIGMGWSLPLIVALAPRKSESLASEVGAIYFGNTLGAIAGSLIAGFVLLVGAGTFATIRIAALVHTGVAALALVPHGDGAPVPLRNRRFAGFCAVLVAVALLLVSPWPPELLSLGSYLYSRGVGRTPLQFDAYFARAHHQLLDSREGVSALVSVWQFDGVRSLRVNGKTDASSGADMSTQVNLALRPMLTHPNPERVLVIGAGSAVTARIVASFPRVKSIDLIEIEPTVLEMLPWFEAINRNVTSDPRVRVTIDDGRNFLLTHNERWDVIISEPSNPWMAGVANLFTREFYSLVRTHLNEDGVFAQWIQPYDISSPTLRRMGATVTSEFPQSELWWSRAGDLIALASNRPLRTSLSGARAWFDSGAMTRGELSRVLGSSRAEDLLLGHLLDREGMLRWIAGALPFTDDPPALEFAVMRTLGDLRWIPRVRRDILDARIGLCGFATDLPLAPGFADHNDGRLRYAWDDQEGARASFTAALEANPSGENAAWLGMAERELQRPGAARESWQLAVLLDPGQRLARLRLAEQASATGDLPAAAAALAGISPEQTGAHDLEVRRAECEVALRAGDAGRSLGCLAQLGRLALSVPDPGTGLGDFLALARAASSVARDRLPELLAILDDASDFEPRAFDIAATAASLSEGLGDPAASLARYDAVLMIAPDAAAFAGRARCLAALGRGSEARAAVAALKRYEPWSTEAARIERKLDLEAAQGLPSR